MKKIAIIMLLALTLASCTTKDNKKAETNTKTQTETKKEVESNKTVVSKGDTITVTYTGSLDDGTIFDASSKHPGQPLTFKAGAGQMIPGFDKAVIGMKLGEEKTVKIPSEDAYGPVETIVPEEVFAKLEEFGLKKSDIKVGDNPIPKTGGVLKIIKIEDGKYYAKNPNKYAGKDLTFQIKIVEIK